MDNPVHNLFDDDDNNDKNIPKNNLFVTLKSDSSDAVAIDLLAELSDEPINEIISQENNNKDDLVSNIVNLSIRDIKNSIECDSGKLIVNIFDLENNFCHRKKRLGEGTFGKVYLVHLHTRLVALKVPNDDPQVESAAKLSMRNEIEALIELKQMNIIRMYDYKMDDKSPWFTMEYCGENSSLKYLVDHKAPLPLATIKSITKQLLVVISYMHDKHYIHCDIKSDNILLVPDNVGSYQIKLIDFGSVKKFEQNIELHDGVNGTEYTMAPELFSMGDEITYDRRIDVYSIGCVVIEMHTGMRKCSYIGPPSYPKDINDVEKDFLDRCLSDRKEREDAYQLLKHSFVNDNLENQP